MNLGRYFGIGLAIAIAFGTSLSAHAQNTADAHYELTFTLSDVTITDTTTNDTRSAIFETTGEVGDLIFEDFGPNGQIYGGESNNNPAGSIGSYTASEMILLNGLDPFVDDYDQDSFGIGDSVVSTMDVFASAETPGSIFFSQVSSDNSLHFSTFGEETERYTFHFDYSGIMTGTLDSSPLSGVTLAFADGQRVSGNAEDTISGGSSTFDVLTDYYSMGDYNDSSSSVQVNDSISGSFEVAFAPGDSGLSIIFETGFLVNAGVTAVPEPASLGLLAFAVLPQLFIRRRR